MLLDRIELFVKVSKHESLSMVARGLHVSVSSVSQRLKSLENHFGVKLYQRNKNGIELTDAGRILLRTATQVLHQLDTLRKTLNSNEQKAVETLVVGATRNPSAKMLPSAIAAFQKTHPEIKISFVTSSRRRMEKRVRDGSVRIAIIQSPLESCMADLMTEYFALDTLAFFAHPRHALTKKQKISFNDLADTPLIVRDGNATTHELLTRLTSRNLTLNVALRCVSPDAVKAAVRRRMGIGILFHDLIEEDVRSGELKILRVTGLPRLVGKSYIVYDRTKPLTATATAFLELLRDVKSSQKRPINIRNLTGTDPP